jgi:hypothetical protein
MLGTSFRITFVCICVGSYDLILHSLDEDIIFSRKMFFTLQFTPNWDYELAVSLQHNQ